MVAIGKKAVRTQPATADQDKVLPERITKEQLAETVFQLIPVDALPPRYLSGTTETICQWLVDLCDTQAPIAMVSWFQLNLLYERQTGDKGVRYQANRKQWKSAKDETKYTNFVRRTKYLSKYLVQGITQQTGQDCRPVHLKPAIKQSPSGLNAWRVGSSRRTFFWPMQYSKKTNRDLDQCEHWLISDAWVNAPAPFLCCSRAAEPLRKVRKVMISWGIPLYPVEIGD